MICPHCSTVVRFDWHVTSPKEIDEDNKVGIEIFYSECPNCNKLVVGLQKGNFKFTEYKGLHITEEKVEESKSKLQKLSSKIYDYGVKTNNWKNIVILPLEFHDKIPRFLELGKNLGKLFMN